MTTDDELVTPVDVRSDNVTRTHLANERTFLAWVRTAVNLLALGLGVAAFLERPSEVVRQGLAVASIVAGGVILFLGFHRYRVMRDQIEAETRYRPFTRAAALATAAVAVLVIGAIAVVLAHE